MNGRNFYITTTLPYVNAAPHIGFGQEIVAADVIARYQRLLGNRVIFNTGTDEHGQKIYMKAVEAGKNPQDYTDEYAAKFASLKELLNLSFTHFIRTTDKHHVAAAQEFWRRCQENGDIYKRMYKITYCVGCELEKQASELENGRCILHPHLELEIREEENYFFRFSKYEEALLNLYENKSAFVAPESKLKEITAFVKAGLQDFSISRLKEKMPWGIPVPEDPDHVMYVWFDALVNYVSTLGWPDDNSDFSKFWPGIQVAGKDNLRQQSAMWQAMLLSAGLQPSEKILINGFISVDGQKMSKSLGNVISPEDMVKRYGLDATRYLLMNLGPFGEDMDVTWDKLDVVYTADLANGLGNLVSRVSKLAEKLGISYQADLEFSFPSLIHHELDQGGIGTLPSVYDYHLQEYQLSEALKSIFAETEVPAGKALAHGRSVAELDKYLAETRPWQMPTETAHTVLQEVIADLILLARRLEPFMPDTSSAVISTLTTKPVRAATPLFPRLS